MFTVAIGSGQHLIRSCISSQNNHGLSAVAARQQPLKLPMNYRRLTYFCHVLALLLEIARGTCQIKLVILLSIPLFGLFADF